MPVQRFAGRARQAPGSLDEPAEKGIEAAWAKEIERRIRDVESGKVKLVPWSEVRRGLRGRPARFGRA